MQRFNLRVKGHVSDPTPRREDVDATSPFGRSGMWTVSGDEAVAHGRSGSDVLKSMEVAEWDGVSASPAYRGSDMDLHLFSVDIDVYR